MVELIREPIGLRVLLRALRPEDHEPFLLWRAEPQPEADALMELGQAEDRALLWASLLRWSEAEAVARLLAQEGWTVTLHGVRAIALPRAVASLRPPCAGQGWLFDTGELRLRAVPESPAGDDESVIRLLDFLDP